MPLDATRRAATRSTASRMSATRRSEWSACRCSLSDGSTIGTLYLATSLDRRFAQQLGELAQTNIAIVSDGTLVASTLPAETQRQFSNARRRYGSPTKARSTSMASRTRSGVCSRIGDTSFYALTSIDDAARAAVGQTTQRADLHCDRRHRPGAARQHLDRASAERSRSDGSPHRSTRWRRRASSTRALPLTGFSLELDALTETFNALMASVAAAEAETEAAYTAAIRALAAALDARDPVHRRSLGARQRRCRSPSAAR